MCCLGVEKQEKFKSNNKQVDTIYDFVNNKNMYFNYHAKIKKLILQNHATEFKIFENYHGITPCLVIYFDDGKAFPIRKHKFEEYLFLLAKFDIQEKK